VSDTLWEFVTALIGLCVGVSLDSTIAVKVDTAFR
jgi:hypothetical protein